MTQRGPKVVLFLCTANYYRSRFAEVLFDSVAGKIGLPWKAASRGLALERGGRNVGTMAASALRALEARGIRAGAAVARPPLQASAADLEQADRVVALTRDEHQPLVEERFPGHAGAVEYWEIDDGPDAPAQIEKAVMALVVRIMGGVAAPEDPPPAEPPPPVPPRKVLAVKVGRETAGRRGKGVTTVFDVPLDDAGLRDLAATLKARCGSGGTVKDGRIEIQGDNRERVAAELEKLGFKVKRVGG